VTAHRSPLDLARRQFLHNRAAMAGLVMLAVLVVASLLAPLVAPYDPVTINLAEKL
jgi:ABC-type antimicrobial peptide transport system permease subunit